MSGDATMKCDFCQETLAPGAAMVECTQCSMDYCLTCDGVVHGHMQGMGNAAHLTKRRYKALNRTTGAALPVLCGNCEYVQADCYCEACSTFYCGGCDAGMHRLKKKKTHVRVAIMDLTWSEKGVMEAAEAAIKSFTVPLPNPLPALAANQTPMSLTLAWNEAKMRKAMPFSPESTPKGDAKSATPSSPSLSSSSPPLSPSHSLRRDGKTITISRPHSSFMISMQEPELDTPRDDMRLPTPVEAAAAAPMTEEGHVVATPTTPLTPPKKERRLQCTICYDNEATVYCDECNMYFCDANGCNASMHSSDATKGHVRHKVTEEDHRRQMLLTQRRNSVMKMTGKLAARSQQKAEEGSVGGSVAATTAAAPVELFKPAQDKLCVLCNTGKASIFCMQCDMYLCTENRCDQDLHADKEFAGHRRVPCDHSAAKISPAASRRNSIITMRRASLSGKLDMSGVADNKPTLSIDTESEMVPDASLGTPHCGLCFANEASVFCEDCDMAFCDENNCNEETHMPDVMHGHTRKPMWQVLGTPDPAVAEKKKKAQEEAQKHALALQKSSDAADYDLNRKCDLCMENLAVSYCPDCVLYLCKTQNCDSDLHQPPVMHLHERVDLNKLRSSTQRRGTLFNRKPSDIMRRISNKSTTQNARPRTRLAHASSVGSIAELRVSGQSSSSTISESLDEKLSTLQQVVEEDLAHQNDMYSVVSELKRQMTRISEKEEKIETHLVAINRRGRQESKKSIMHQADAKQLSKVASDVHELKQMIIDSRGEDGAVSGIGVPSGLVLLQEQNRELQTQMIKMQVAFKEMQRPRSPARSPSSPGLTSSRRGSRSITPPRRASNMRLSSKRGSMLATPNSGKRSKRRSWSAKDGGNNTFSLGLSKRRSTQHSPANNSSTAATFPPSISLNRGKSESGDLPAPASISSLEFEMIQAKLSALEKAQQHLQERDEEMKTLQQQLNRQRIEQEAEALRLAKEAAESKTLRGKEKKQQRNQEAEQLEKDEAELAQLQRQRRERKRKQREAERSNQRQRDPNAFIWQRREQTRPGKPWTGHRDPQALHGIRKSLVKHLTHTHSAKQLSVEQKLDGAGRGVGMGALTIDPRCQDPRDTLLEMERDHEILGYIIDSKAQLKQQRLMRTQKRQRKNRLKPANVGVEVRKLKKRQIMLHSQSTTRFPSSAQRHSTERNFKRMATTLMPPKPAQSQGARRGKGKKGKGGRPGSAVQKASVVQWYRESPNRYMDENAILALTAGRMLMYGDMPQNVLQNLHMVRKPRAVAQTGAPAAQVDGQGVTEGNAEQGVVKRIPLSLPASHSYDLWAKQAFVDPGVLLSGIRDSAGPTSASEDGKKRMQVSESSSKIQFLRKASAHKEKQKAPTRSASAVKLQ